MKFRALGAVVAVAGLLVAMAGTALADHELVVVAGKAGEAPSAICTTAGMKQAAIDAQHTTEAVALLTEAKVDSAYVGSVNDLEVGMVLRADGMVAPFVPQVNDAKHALCGKPDVAPAKTEN
ncbi:hypothetical protein ACFVMC_29920 [Nocardia sp. NPDC127579]|uniref:hypothetical protein n=1 Tax=Nocardia sp. NPDC127579 TaxID=3345402 RepID=UPI00362A6E17